MNRSQTDQWFYLTTLSARITLVTEVSSCNGARELHHTPDSIKTQSLLISISSGRGTPRPGWRDAEVIAIPAVICWNICPRVAEAHPWIGADVRGRKTRSRRSTGRGGGFGAPHRRPGSRRRRWQNARSGPSKWLARVSAHARDAGMCNSCGPRAETRGQGWQLEMKDRWGRAHLTECYMEAGRGGVAKAWYYYHNAEN